MKTVDSFEKYSIQVTLMSAMDKGMLHTGSFHAGITRSDYHADYGDLITCIDDAQL